MKIVVLSALRDCEPYLRNFAFREWASWEHRADISWYFIENDSRDSTREALDEFVSAPNRRARLLCARLSRQFRHNRLSTNAGRIYGIAAARNALLEVARPEIACADWVLVLDADIYYSPFSILDLMHTAPDSSCAVLPYTEQVERRNAHGATPIPEDVGLTGVTLRHYYDTFASFDADGVSFYPYCAWDCARGCARATGREGKARRPDSSPPVEVKCGFGGAAAIRPTPLLCPSVRWDGLCMDGAGADASSLCEHVLFFDRLRAVATAAQEPDRVYVQPAVRAWRTK